MHGQPCVRLLTDVFVAGPRDGFTPATQAGFRHSTPATPPNSKDTLGTVAGSGSLC
jgi:hypothetical protein